MRKAIFYLIILHLNEKLLMGVKYYKGLTIQENAEKNKCSISAVKAHLRKLNLSASKVRANLISETIDKAIRRLKKEGKKDTISAIRDLTGYSNKTIIKYKENGVQMDMSKNTPLSYSFRQQEILQNIITLYNHGNPIECDLTFSVGKMWKGLHIPKYCFDLKPELPFVKQLDESRLYEDFFQSCILDLPFIIHPYPKEANAIICNRFDAFNSEQELLETNTSMLRLALQILKNKAICVVKTQDTCHAGRQIWTHVYIMNEAEKIGFKIEDIFICLAKNMLVNQNNKARHARKQHCYFIVLRKVKK